MKNRLLEVGDVLYAHSVYRSRLEKHNVIRVTKTQAICDSGCKFRNKEPNEFSSFTAIGDSGYGRTYYELETPELILQYKRDRLVAEFDGFNPERYKSEVLEQILELIKE